MKSDCIFHKHCKAPLCPKKTREENLGFWLPHEPVCYLEKGVPFWVKQQRKIVDQIKFKNRFAPFDQRMLEAPLKVTGNVIGLNVEESGCLNCDRIIWFMNNQLPLPDEIEKHHHKENWSPFETPVWEEPFEIPVWEEPEDDRTVH